MNDGLKRNIRLVLHNFAVAAPQLASLLVIGVVYYFYLDMSAFVIVAVFATLFQMIMCISSYTVTFKYAVGFGSTKRNFYMGGIANKLIYTLVFVVIATFVSVVEGFYPFGTLSGIIFILAMSMLAGVLGDFFGLLMYKSAALGFTVYIFSILVIVIAGTVISINFINGSEGDIGLAAWFGTGAVQIGLLLVCAASAVVLSAVNWILLKGTEIKN